MLHTSGLAAIHSYEIPSIFMELRSNSSVLRSNAPGKTDSPKGVLQVSSGNIGSSNLESSLGVAKGTAFDKYEADVPPLSTVPRCQSAQATLKLQRRKQRRVQDGESESLDTYPMYSQIITQAERLSPRYQTYREKQRKEFVKGSNQEQKWPDELEDVFQQGVCPNGPWKDLYAEVDRTSFASDP